MNDAEHMNLFSPAMRDALIGGLEKLSDDPKCRAIVLTGAGDHFSAGGDIKSFNEADAMSGRARLKRGSGPLARLLAAGPKPVIAAVKGNCYGAGLSMAAACDYVIAERSAKFCAAFIRMGFIPDVGLLWSLPRRVGHGKAKQLMALATVLDAQAAAQAGLADEIVEAADLHQRAQDMASRFASAPPLTMALLRSAMADGLEEVLRTEIDYQPVLMTTEDHAEAKRAFFEKRKPQFRGY